MLAGYTLHEQAGRHGRLCRSAGSRTGRWIAMSEGKQEPIGFLRLDATDELEIWAEALCQIR